MSDGGVFSLGVFCGAAAMVLFLILLPGTIMDDYHRAQDECEKSLPRDQQCEMYFKPINQPKG